MGVSRSRNWGEEFKGIHTQFYFQLSYHPPQRNRSKMIKNSNFLCELNIHTTITPLARIYSKHYS